MSCSHHKGKFGVGGLSPNMFRDEIRVLGAKTFWAVKRDARVKRARAKQEVNRKVWQKVIVIEVD